MKRFISTLMASLAIAALGGVTGAHAEAWTIDYITATSPSNTVPNTPDSAMLTVITDNTMVNGAYTVTSISGERDGLMVTGLSPYAASDQLLFQVNPYFDLSGLSFTDSTGEAFNLFTNGSYYELSSNVDAVGYPQNGVALTSLNVSDVPEPLSLTLLGTGLIGLGMTRRKRIAQLP